MEKYKYCLEIAEKTIKDGCVNYRFKQKFLGNEECLEDLKKIVDDLKTKKLKARIIDWSNCNEIYQNYYSLIW